MKRRTIVLLTGLVLGGLLLASCGGSSNEARTPATTTRPRATTATTAPGGTATTGAPTTAPAGAACTPTGSTADVRVDYPNRMSSLVGKSVRTGAHPCLDRFVIELQPGDQLQPGFPGYWVRYATGPIALSPSDQPVTLQGGAVLLVSLGSWMQSPGPVGLSGPRDAFPTNVSVIREYRLIEDFEGQSTWALGLDTKRNFTVSVLSGPPRLVVDIQTAP